MITYTEQDVERFMSKIDVDKNGCWIWCGSMIDTGYGKFALKCVKQIRAHKFSYILFNGEYDAGLQINHTCGVRRCVNPEHLYAGTHRDNMDDLIASEKLCGENNGQSKLTEIQVLEIRAKYVRGKYGYRRLAKEYGITGRQVEHIIKRLQWTHI